jgi:hypothetical protein
VQLKGRVKVLHCIHSVRWCLALFFRLKRRANCCDQTPLGVPSSEHCSTALLRLCAFRVVGSLLYSSTADRPPYSLTSRRSRLLEMQGRFNRRAQVKKTADRDLHTFIHSRSAPRAPSRAVATCRGKRWSSLRCCAELRMRGPTRSDFFSENSAEHEGGGQSLSDQPTRVFSSVTVQADPYARTVPLSCFV